MKKTVSIILCFLIFLGLTSEKRRSEPDFDWTKLTDRNCYIKFTKIVYESPAKKNFAQKLTNLANDTNAFLISKDATKLLQELLLDTTNFIDQVNIPKCSETYYSKAFVVFYLHKTAGIINIGCNGNYWVFDPSLKTMQSAILSKKGELLKNKLLSEIPGYK